MTDKKSDSKNKFYLYISFILNVKTEQKGDKLINLIQKEVGLEYTVNDKFNQNDNSWHFGGYFVLESFEIKEAIFETLIRLNNVGYNWICGCPNYYGDKFWSFMGHRTHEPQNFRISGVNFSDFELTNRPPDYIRISPFMPEEEVEIVENDITIEAGIAEKKGRVFALTGLDEHGLDWTYIIEIERKQFNLSESDLKTK